MEKFVRGKMAEKAQENAAALAEADEEEDEPESEEGEQPDRDGDDDDVKVTPKKKKAPKKKVTSAGMQLPEYWPWQEAKKLFIKPDVVSGDDLEVSLLCFGEVWLVMGGKEAELTRSVGLEDT